MKKVIEVVVSPTGESRIETRGYSGSTCREATEALERALGTRSQEQLKPEFYESEQIQQRASSGH
jgi:hypothetical protein